MSKEIELSQGKVALVDDEDFDILNRYKWYAYQEKSGHWYVKRTPSINGKRVPEQKMHRVILGLQPGDKIQTDHINHNGLDNRRENLRKCTHAENQYNQRIRQHSSRYKGVSWDERRGKWIAQIRINGGNEYLGCFNDEDNAAKAYNLVAIGYFGGFANLNEIKGV